MTPTEQQIRKAAEAIANARIMRRGSPPIANVWDMLPSRVRDEVTEDATAALEAVGMPTNRDEVVRVLRSISGICKREATAMATIERDGHLVAIEGLVVQAMECFVKMDVCPACNRDLSEIDKSRGDYDPIGNPLCIKCSAAQWSRTLDGQNGDYPARSHNAKCD